MADSEYIQNIYTPEEMASYKKFAHRTQELSDADLFKINNNLVADQLTTEMKDIVAWEIKIREIETLKRQGIDPSKEFSYKNTNSEVKYDKYMLNKNTVSKYVMDELRYTEGMSDELLKKSMKIIEEHPQVIKEEEIGKLFNRNGGGINIMTKKFLVECKNGEILEFDNQAIQEHFRKEYIKRMSQVTGIDYTKYDLNAGSEIYGGYEDDIQNGNEMAKKSDKTIIDMRFDKSIDNINFDDYEDDYEDD